MGPTFLLIFDSRYIYIISMYIYIYIHIYIWVCNGKSYSNGWFRGTSISGNLHIFAATAFHRGAIHLRRWSRWTWRENSRRSHLSTTKMRRPIGFHNVKRDLKQPIRVSQCSELGFTNIFYNIIYGCFTMLTKNNKKYQKICYTAIPKGIFG